MAARSSAKITQKSRRIKYPEALNNFDGGHDFD